MPPVTTERVFRLPGSVLKTLPTELRIPDSKPTDYYLSLRSLQELFPTRLGGEIAWRMMSGIAQNGPSKPWMAIDSAGLINAVRIERAGLLPSQWYGIIREQPIYWQLQLLEAVTKLVNDGLLRSCFSRCVFPTANFLTLIEPLRLP